MTVAQQVTTVPLILKAEVFEQAGEAKAPPAHVHESEAAAATEHEHGGGWAPQDGFERTAFTLAANVLTGIGFALLLIAVSELAGGISTGAKACSGALRPSPCSRSRPVLGFRRSFRPCRRLSLGHVRSGGLPPRSPPPGASRSWSMGDRRLPRLPAWRCLWHRTIIGAPQPLSHDSPIPENSASQLRGRRGVDDAGVLCAARRTHRLFPAAVGRHCLTMEEPTHRRARAA